MPASGLRRVQSALSDDHALKLRDDESVLLRCDVSLVIVIERVKDEEVENAEDATARECELFVTTSRVVFASMDDTYECDYHSLALHAISRSDERFGARGCVYCQVDDDASGSSAETATTHAYVSPTEATTVETIYAAMSEGSMMNPDSSDGESDDDARYDEDDEATLRRLDDLVVVEDEVEALMRNDPGRFEDGE